MDRAVEPSLTVATRYQSGFGNHFATEALPGALPPDRNSPQRPAYGLYAEQFSGTAFTAPRHANRRTWLYRILPAAVHGDFRRIDDGRITSSFGECEMEIQIRLDERFGIILCRIHDLDLLAHGLERFVVRACGSQRRDLGLENLADFGEKREAFVAATHHSVERLANGVGGAVGDEGAAARVSLDQTFFAKGFHRFADGGAAHAKLFGKFALGR